jgi:hypothetical protein
MTSHWSWRGEFKLRSLPLSITYLGNYLNSFLSFAPAACMLVHLNSKHPMKTPNTTHRRSTLSSWQHPPRVKSTVLRRIRTITTELEAIQAEMHDELTGSENKIARFFEDNTALQTLNDLKAELDQLRRILWFYIEETAANITSGAKPEQQAQRLQHFTELLRALSTPDADEAAEKKPAASFFERLDVVMDTYMQDKNLRLKSRT